MGFAITWLACPEARAEALLRQLSLQTTGETEEVPESPISQFRTKSGWRVIWVNEYACPFLAEPQLATASQQTDLLLVLVEEHVMASAAEGWSQGRRQWRIAHEGEDGPVGLAVAGTPPAAFAGIRADLERAQEEAGGAEADVDHLFDIPLALAESLTGFKHDAATEGSFEVLQRNVPPPPGFLKRLFGG